MGAHHVVGMFGIAASLGEVSFSSSR